MSDHADNNADPPHHSSISSRSSSSGTKNMMTSSTHSLSSHVAAALAPSRALTKGKNISRRSVYGADMTYSLPDCRGFLSKKSSNGRWQKRWFYVNNSYLCYKKDEGSDKIDATIDLRATTDIAVDDRFGNFSLKFAGDTNSGTATYMLRGKDNREASHWVNALKKRQEYYDRIRVAGQSEVTELFLEEEVSCSNKINLP